MDTLLPTLPTVPPPAPVPATTTLISGPDVWMEGDATLQLAAVAQLEGCVRVAGMPDLHPGRGYPVGAVVATRDVIHPQLIGGDAGCGARVIATSLARVAPDPLERRLRAEFAAPVVADADPRALFAAAWARGARGLADVDGLPDGLRALAAREPDADDLPASGDPERYAAGFAAVLGTVGGGNHFAEIARVEDVRDPDVAAAAGLARHGLVVLAHSGSRGLGAALGLRWGARPVRADDRAVYLGELAGACRFARANRLVVGYRLLAALGALRPHSQRGGFDVTHNDVRREPVDGADAWVHRKGAAPAAAAALTVVLGSRGAPSWIMRGTGAALEPQRPIGVERIGPDRPAALDLVVAAPARAVGAGDGRGGPGMQQRGQPIERAGQVGVLRPLAGAAHRQAGRHVLDPDRRRHLVDVLAARPTGATRGDHQLRARQVGAAHGDRARHVRVDRHGDEPALAPAPAAAALDQRVGADLVGQGRRGVADDVQRHRPRRAGRAVRGDLGDHEATRRRQLFEPRRHQRHEPPHLDRADAGGDLDDVRGHSFTVTTGTSAATRVARPWRSSAPITGSMGL